MSHATEQISRTLRSARKTKGLSQRVLSAKSGVPQSHISKIENGAVDLRVSSLVELARVLDLELTLVPRKSVSAVKSIVRSSKLPRPVESARTADWARWSSIVNKLAHEHPQKKEYAQILRYLRDLQHFRLSDTQAEEFRSRYKKLFANLKQNQDDKLAHIVLFDLQNLRNRLAHASHATDADGVRPAYSLDEDDDG